MGPLHTVELAETIRPPSRRRIAGLLTWPRAGTAPPNKCCQLAPPDRGAAKPGAGPRPAVFRNAFDSKEMQPVHMRLLCRLQLRDGHAYKSNRVLRIDHDYRACLGVMRLTQHLRSCVIREQGVIKRKYVLIDVVVLDRFLAEIRIEHQRVRAGSASEGIVGSGQSARRRHCRPSALCWQPVRRE